MIGFDRACALLEKALAGDLRREAAGELAQARDLRTALLRLRRSLRDHDWASRDGRLTLDKLIAEYDRQTRREGLHVLHDWDGKADRLNAESIPVDVLDFVAAHRADDSTDATTIAILIDYYFLYVVALLSLRIWDGVRPDENLDRLAGILEHLQGPLGSGQQFARDAETLILIATSHFELEERGYHLLLERVRSLNHSHQTKIALGHAVAIGSHLRFGFEATYARDTAVMRNDNVADYPWLCFSVFVLMKEYERRRESGEDTDTIAEALLNGLSADARAFVGEAPASLSSSEAERAAFREAFVKHRDELTDRFERYRPAESAYSPLSFFFNFSHNVLKGTVVDALLRGTPWQLTLNDLLTSTAPPGVEQNSQIALATTLMAYARAAPDTIRGRLMPVIVYDPSAGRQAFTATLKKLQY